MPPGAIAKILPNAVTEAGIVVLLALGLSSCATTDVLTGAPLPISLGKEEPDLLLQIANNRLLVMVLEDAAATEAWVASQPAMDPVKKELALQCPRFVRLAALDFRDKVLALKAVLDQLGMKVEEIDVAKPRLMLRLTQLKYGEGLDLRGKIEVLRDDIRVRGDAIFLGCAHLFPRKQLAELSSLLFMAGLLPSTGGLAALFL